MSEMKHTPGPWRINVSGSDRWSVDYDGPSSTYITICGKRSAPVCFAVEPSAYKNDEEVEANARLIAAAPELLEAADHIDRTATDIADDMVVISGTGYRLLRAAIAKATGAPQ